MDRIGWVDLSGAVDYLVNVLRRSEAMCPGLPSFHTFGQTYSKSSKPTASKVVAAIFRSPLSAARHIVMYSGR